MPRFGLALGALALGAALFVSPALAQSASQSLYVFLYQPGQAWKAGLPMAKQDLGPHARYIRSLLTEGRLCAGGGFQDQDGGMAIVRAASFDEARAMLAADPAVTSGVFKGEVHHWVPRFVAPGPLAEPKS